MLKMRTTVQIDVVQGAIDQATYYLINNLRANGMFRYRINTNSTVKLRPKYDILHHASCVYALSLYNQYRPHREVSLAVQRSAHYLLKQALQPIPGERATLAVWARPDVQNTTKPLQAKLDGAGVGLLALLSAHEVQPTVVPLKYAQALGRFMVYMQQGDDRFYSRYVPLFGGKTELQPLQHYPLEAVLGLMMLYEKDGDALWLETACRVLSRIIRNGPPTSIAEVSPGTLLALGKLLALGAETSIPIARTLVTTYAMKTCELVLTHQVDAPRQPRYDGGFSKDGTVLPTAAWIEGLLATLEFLPTGDRRVEPMRDAVSRGVTFLLQAQIRDGEWSGAMPRAVGPLRSRRGTHASFNQRATEVRIEHVQSALRAWLKYVALAPVAGLN